MFKIYDEKIQWSTTARVDDRNNEFIEHRMRRQSAGRRVQVI